MKPSNKGQETAWHRGLLVVILVAAAAARFYALDKQSLNFYGLSQLASCDQDAWLGLINHYVGFSGLPPLYPTVLCAFLDGFGHSDFIARTPSALAGLASVYFLYLIGRDFFSPTTGLVAAALLAMNYQILLFDREVSINSLLLLCFLAHGYCFGHLFYTRDSSQGRPFELGFQGPHSSLTWRWNPPLPLESRFVVGFWITAGLAFYTSSMTAVLLMTELVASAYFLRRRFAADKASVYLRTLWLPVGITLLPWLPIWMRYLGSIPQGYIFGLETPTAVWNKAKLLFPLDPLFMGGAAALLTGLIGWMIFQKYVRRTGLPTAPLFQFLAFYWSVALIALFTVESDYSSYAYLSWLTVLLLVLPLALWLDSISSTLHYRLVLGALVLLILAVQTRSNYQYDLYARTKGSDFRLAVRIISEDENFLNNNGVVVRSHTVFDYYLTLHALTHGEHLLDNRQLPDNLQSWFGHPEFYFLDLVEGGTESDAFRQLQSRYPLLCVTRLPPRIHLAKFSSVPGSLPSSAEPPDCRSYLNDHIRLTPP